MGMYLFYYIIITLLEIFNDINDHIFYDMIMMKFLIYICTIFQKLCRVSALILDHLSSFLFFKKNTNNSPRSLYFSTRLFYT